MTTEFKVLGTTGDVTTCDCCGRSNLNKTVVVEIDGEIAHFGVVCAAHKAGFAALDINRMAKAANEQKRQDAIKAEAERIARVKQHPLYLQGVAMRDALTAEFGFWSRCPENDPRKNWYVLCNMAGEDTV
jgi:hypothetical protein